MRIDYREPRQYGSGSTGHPPQRKTERSSSVTVVMVLILLSAGFGLGFATGWHFSQKSTKKAFRAAMEQQSLESQTQTGQPLTSPAASPATTTPTAGQQQTAPQTTDTVHDSKTQSPVQASPAAPVPLSFFDNLPRGQKQTVLGSGINEKPKPEAPPTPPPQPVQKQVTQPAAPVSAAPKPAAVPAASGFVVQVASFSSRKEAEATRARLAAKGYSATISEVELNDKGTWYRVRIGRHLEKEAATEIASKIGGGAKIVPDQE